ncbi:unnamed protein product, partial [Ilex paraguariensis]
ASFLAPRTISVSPIAPNTIDASPARPNTIGTLPKNVPGALTSIVPMGLARQCHQCFHHDARPWERAHDVHPRELSYDACPWKLGVPLILLAE